MMHQIRITVIDKKAHGVNYFLPFTILGFHWKNVVFKLHISENMDLHSREHFSNLKQCPMILFGGKTSVYVGPISAYTSSRILVIGTLQ